ncbi:MAG: hypothetical protein ACI9S8_002287 [Chlamydiales bacterium]|jgi:hypothetical protein
MTDLKAAFRNFNTRPKGIYFMFPLSIVVLLFLLAWENERKEKMLVG